MTSGITIYNSENVIQADENYTNLYVSRILTLNPGASLNMNFGTNEIMAAVGGTASPTINALCKNNVSGFSCTHWGGNEELKVYILGIKPKREDHGYGVQIFKSDGSIAFDSMQLTARVIAFGGQSGSSVPNASKYAIACGENAKTSQTVVTWKTTKQSSTAQPRQEYESYIDYEWETNASGIPMLKPVTKYHWVTHYDTLLTYTYSSTATVYTQNYNMKMNGGKMEMDHISDLDSSNSYDGKSTTETLFIKEGEAWLHPTPPDTTRIESRDSFNPCSFLIFDVSNVE